MEVIINKCYGGYGLSHRAVMLYAERKGIKLYPFVHKMTDGGRADFDHLEPYTKNLKRVFLIHYSTRPLNKKGKIDNEAYFSDDNIGRSDPVLIQIIKELGEAANGDCAELSIVDIPDGVEYEIEEYDGMEHIAEKHRTWS